MPARILIVDDDDQIRRVLALRLERDDYAVEEAADGHDAIRKLATEKFDLVVADIVMPNKDGLELIMHLRDNHPEVRVIAISAPGNELYLDIASGLGAARVFPKPFELDDLVNAVADVLAGDGSDR